MTYLPSRIPEDTDTNTDIITIVNNALVWAIPAALTELGGVTVYRTCADLSTFTQGRLCARITATTVDADLGVEYSTNESTWDSAIDATISTAETGVKATAWTNLTPDAMNDVFLRLVGSGGNGILTVSLGIVGLQLR